MNAKPLKGWVLLQKVVIDFTTAGTAERPLILPVGEKSSSFFNRSRVLEMPPPELEDLTATAPGRSLNIKEPPFKKGDIVVTTDIAGQLGVPGSMKDEYGQLRHVVFCPIDQIVAVLEGDDAVLEEVPPRPPIITDIASKNGGKR